MPPRAAPGRTAAAAALWRHVDPGADRGHPADRRPSGASWCTPPPGSRCRPRGSAPIYYVKKQIIFMIVGVLAMAAAVSIDYRRYRDWAPVIYGFCILMLLAVYAVGHRSKGAQAWFQVGSYQLEPSEFAKIGLIIALASFCAASKGRLAFRGLILVLILAALPSS